jgi:hypothetical protein
MAAITVACVALFLLVTFGDVFEIVVMSVLWCVLPTPAIILAIYARGDVQAFAIGALVPWVILMMFRIPNSYFAATLWLLPMAVICGALAAATHRWIKSNLRDQ